MSSTTQSEVANALTAAMQAIADSSAQAQDATLTIEAEIVEVLDEGLGTYKVLYLGNKFEATTAHTEITYTVGDMVYVIIPNGNFDKNKVILSPVTPSTAAYAVTDDGRSYVTLGENIFASVADVALCTYKPHDADPSGADPSPIVAIDTTGFAALFQNALTDSRTFNFTCKIQTNIEKERRSKGNYGLILDIPVKQVVNETVTSKYYSVVMDINNITGDPYNLQVSALQNFYFDLPEDVTYDESKQPRIRSFVVGFLGEDSTAPDDIWIKDIQLLSAVELSEEDKTGYFVTIAASEGTGFLASRTSDTKTLSVTAYLNGKVTQVSSFDCYWFKENVLIDATSDKFQKFGGVGWEILNKVSKKATNEDGTISYQYVTNVFTQVVSQSDIHCDTRFKCVLVKSDKVVSATTAIKNLASDATVELTTTAGSTVYPVGVGDVELKLTYKESGITDVTNPSFVVGYAWQRFDKKGNYLDNNFYIIKTFNQKSDNTFTTTISYPVSELDETNTIACTVYVDTPSDDIVKRQTIGTVWITVTTGEAATARIVVSNGDRLYKYDADGDSPMVADYDGPLTSALKEITPLSVAVFKEDGTELTTSEYAVTTITWLVPVQSMITLTQAQKTDTISNPGYYTIKGKYTNGYNALSYGIANTYNKKKTNNSIIIKASAPSAVLKEEARVVAPLQFLKDGEGGTNGSKYSAIITYGGYGYGEVDAYGLTHKLQLVYAYDNDTWYLYNPAQPGKFSVFSSAQLGTVLYADGESVGSGSAVFNIFDNKYSYNQDAIVSPISISSTGLITLNDNKWTDWTQSFCATIEARVNAQRASTLASQTNSEEYVYAYYPIECTYVASYQYLPSCLPSMEGGFSKVLYASDGTNPQYDNSENFYVTDAAYEDDIGSLYDYTWSSSSNMKTGNITGASCKITPTSKYDNGVAKNYVRVQMGRSAQKTSQLQIELDALKTQLTSETNRRIYYQTLQDNVDIFGNFDYNSYVSRITAVANFYNAKIKIVNSSKDLVKYAQRLLQLTENYRNYDSGSRDVKVDMIYHLAEDSLNSVAELASLSSELGTSSQIISLIKTRTPQSLAINQQIDLTNDPRGCYFSINDMINIYNSVINGAYAEAYNMLISSSITSVESVVYGIINELNTFVNDQRLLNLTMAYAEVSEESYRYSALYATLRQYVSTASTYASDSYTALLEKILRPMYESLTYYITFYCDGGYTSTITSINNTITAINNRISVVTNMLLPKDSVNIVHIKPVIMIFNRYELSNLNGWDGNKMDMGDGYLIAPQVGAGKKESDNSFTGVAIGVKQVAEKSTSGQQIGLFGYSSGKQSIFLNAQNGSATFGVSGAGQVIIDPSSNRAIVKSGNYSTTNKAGMQIDLTTPEMRFGSGSFVVNSSGHLTAAGGGSIAGWDIDDFSIYSKIPVSSGRMVLDSGAIVSGYDSQGNKTYTASSSGRIYTGTHSSIDSTAGGFYLSQDGLSFGSKVRIDSDGKMQLGTGAVNDSSNRHWTLNGTSEKSYIAYNTTDFASENLEDVDNYSIDGGSSQVYIGTDGIRLGNKFAVDNSGNLVAKHLIAKEGGSIGGWAISSTMLSSRNIEIKASGSIETSNFSEGTETGWKITNTGRAYFNYLKANRGGSIAGWTISAAGLASPGNGMTIRSEGSLYGSGWSINRNGVGTFTNIIITGNGASALSTTGSSMNWGNGFSVSTDGKLTATGVDVKGTITATAGKIGNTVISDGALTSANGNFKVDAAGNLIAKSADISGKITATSGSFKGEIEASKFKFDDGAGHTMSMGYSSDHPSVSGLNVGSGGINAGANGIQGGTISARNGFAAGGHGGKTTAFYSIVSNLSVSSSGTIKWKTRTMEMHGGLVTSFSTPEDHVATINTGK